MKRHRLAPAVVLLWTLATACAPADDVEIDDAVPEAAEMRPPASAVPAELETTGERFTEAWNGEDAEALAAFFTENARVIDDDTATFTGRMEIQERWLRPALPVVSNLQDSDQTWEPVGDDFRSAGRFSYTATTPDGDVVVTGRYENLWTREADGQWRISSMRSTADPQPTTGT
jgi:ketosteroid isomerase-like protein